MLKYLSFFEGRGLRVAKAEGQYLWDCEGRKYLDMHTGHGVAFLGHRNPKVTEALADQMGEVMTLTPAFDVRVRDEMLEVLSKVVPRTLSSVALFNSGAEAVEFALKAARRYTGRKKIVAFTNSFHGRTFGALSVTWNPAYREPFAPLVPEVSFLRYNEVGDVYDGINEDVAAVVVEPVQGEGGVVPAEPEFMKAVRERTLEVGALLIADEIQTGFGRTGKVWACEHYGVEPDILVAGKAIGGGFPVSLVAVGEEVAASFKLGEHGSTYGGNPLACAAVKASCEVLLEESVPTKSERAGTLLARALRERLGDHEVVREVRGLGLMLGVKLRTLPGGVIRGAQSRGLLALKAGLTVVRLLPPYLVTRDDVRWCVDALLESLDEEASARAAAQAPG